MQILASVSVIHLPCRAIIDLTLARAPRLSPFPSTKAIGTSVPDDEPSASQLHAARYCAERCRFLAAAKARFVSAMDA